jgi:hypothetical protein
MPGKIYGRRGREAERGCQGRGLAVFGIAKSM